MIMTFDLSPLTGILVAILIPLLIESVFDKAVSKTFKTFYDKLRFRIWILSYAKSEREKIFHILKKINNEEESIKPQCDIQEVDEIFNLKERWGIIKIVRGTPRNEITEIMSYQMPTISQYKEERKLL